MGLGIPFRRSSTSSWPTMSRRGRLITS
jgi:hypothetical protein